MMNRRQFIQMTMSLAAAAAIPAVAITMAKEARVAAGLPPRPQWMPSKEEVAEWLEYYKAYTAGLRPDIHDLDTPVRRCTDSAGIEVTVKEIPEQPTALLARFKAFEAAFVSQESDRGGVAREFLAGYDAGRDGSQRYCARFDRPSNRAYAWYHYWQVGDFDRRYAAGEQSARLEAASWRSPPPGRRHV